MDKLLRFSFLSLFSILCGVAHADLPQTATWDFTNADVVTAAVALSGSTEASTIAAVENNGLLLTIEANGQTIRNNGNSIQTGNPVVFKVPVQGKKDEVTVVGYPGYFAYSIAGTDATEATTSYTATTTDVTQGYVEIVSKGQYIISISVTQNEDNNPQPIAQDITGTWNYGDTDIMAATMAFSGSSEAGEVEAVEKNGLKMIIEANGATFRNNGNNIQVTTGAVFKVPVKNAGDLVTVKGYPGYSKYTIGNNSEVLTDENTYKAKNSDVEAGYVAITSADGNNYYYSLSVTQYAPKEKVTLDNEVATATFAFNEGTEGQVAIFSNADYFLNSKVTHGNGLTLEGKDNKSLNQTWFNPAAKDGSANEGNAIRFIITPKPGFTFTPSKVSLKTTRFGTNGGKLDIAWQNTDGSTVSLATDVQPNRDNGDPNISDLTYTVVSTTVSEGSCGLKINLYSLDNGKRVGFSDIVIEGTLNGTEKDIPILSSFKINGTEYAIEDVFGESYEATLELSKKENMVSSENPMTDITATNGEIGNVNYESTETSCKVIIPVTAGETTMNYVLNIIQKPDYTLSYFDTDGSTLGTQIIEKDKKIGAFLYDIASAKSSEGKKARGWFKNQYVGEKYSVEDVVTGNINLYAIETEIEGPSDSRKYVFNLTDKFFYAEDHEAFNPVGNGHYHNNHGWVFGNGDKVELLVGKKASVTLTLCAYSADVDIEASNGTTVAAKVATDGGMESISYEGEEGILTLTFKGTTYVHGITILNTTTTNYQRKGNKFMVKQGDASSFIDALDAANGESGNEALTIYLPNGTYDLGQATLTTIGRNNISIIGESQQGVIIQNLPTTEGIGVTATLLNTSQYLTLESLTLKNAFPYYDPATGKASAFAGRAVCLQDKGNYTVCRNVTLLSYQDTYYSNNSNGYFYFNNCEIHGLVDFVCGGGDVFFENTLFYLESREMQEGVGGVTIAAPNGGKKYGYVMDHCTVDCHSKDFNWGRAWGSFSGLVWMNTTLKQPSKIVSSRFTAAGMNAAADAFFEYNTMDEDGNAISPTSNIINFTHSTGNKSYETILNANEASQYTKEKVFADTPKEFQDRTGVSDTPTAICLPILSIDTVQNTIYNLQGIRVNKTQKGLYFIKGKKVMVK